MAWRVVLGSLPSIQGSHRSMRIERDADIMTHLITKYSLLLYWAAYCAFETLGRLSCVTLDFLVGFVVEKGRLLAWLDIVLVHVTGTSRGTVVCENIGWWSHVNISNQSIGEVVTKERKRHEIVLAVICSRRGVTPITESGMLHTSFYDSFVLVIIFVLNLMFLIFFQKDFLSSQSHQSRITLHYYLKLSFGKIWTQQFIFFRTFELFTSFSS